MNREIMKKLRLDRRLINRRSWISASDLEQEVEALPDVSHKIAPDEPEAHEKAASEPGSGAAPVGE